MTLLFMDGFDDGLTALKWTSMTGSVGGTGRSGSRCEFSGNSTTGRKVVAAADEHATMILGFAFKAGSTPAPANVFVDLIRFVSDTSGTVHVSLHQDSNNAFVVQRGAWSGTTLGTTAANVIVPGTWQYMEIKVVLHDSTGSVELRVNGVAVLTLTGIDTKNGGTKAVLEGVSFNTIQTGVSFEVDDVYLCNGAGSANNDFLGDCSVETLFPGGNGNSSQLLGSDADSTDNYLLVDEATPSATDYVGSATNGQKDTYAFGNLTHTTGTVKGVQVAAYAAKSDTGTRTMSNVIRSGGSDTVRTAQALATSYTALLDLVEQDPNGPAAWTIASVNAAEFGVQVGAP